jgi:hypothetical protein
LNAKQRRHADEVVKIEEVVSRLVSPEHGVEEIRGIESEEGEDDQSEGEDKERKILRKKSQEREDRLRRIRGKGKIRELIKKR